MANAKTPAAARRTPTSKRPPAAAEPSETRRYLIAPGQDVRGLLQTCPYAATLTAWSCHHNASVIIATRCKRWSCPHCGRRRVASLAAKVTHVKPERFITLTVNPAMWEDPRAAYDGTRRHLSRLTRELRTKYGRFEYCRVLEVTKKGWPHYHLMADCPYIPQPELSQRWARLTGAPIVDVRRIVKAEHVYRYVVKYLAKQTHVPWTDRRVAWTRNFFPPTDFKAGPSMELQGAEIEPYHPESWVYHKNTWMELEQIGSDAWAIHWKAPPLRMPGEEG